MTGDRETLEEWAARVAPSLDADEWRAVEGVAAQPEGTGLCVLLVAWVSVDSARALLAYRDSVAAKVGQWGEGECLRAGLITVYESSYGPGARLVRRTDFGDEIARVLEVRRG